VYSGDSDYTAATSSVLNETVINPADFAVSNTTASQIIPPGASASYNVVTNSVTAPFTNPVALTASGLPAGATYAFTPAVVTPGASGATSTLTISVPKQIARHGNTGVPLFVAMLLLPIATLKRTLTKPHRLLLPFAPLTKPRGKPLRLLLWFVTSFVLLGLAIGCGVGGYFNQPQQAYVITITGTSGNLVRTTTATLTVQ
jgi:hypothetical protein